MHVDSHLAAGLKTDLYPGNTLLLRVKIWARYLACIVMLSALLVLVGWLFHIDFLKQPFPGLGSMNPVSAVLFFFSGGSFLLLMPKAPAQWKKTVGKILAIVVSITGLLRWVSAAYDLDLPIDTFLFTKDLTANIGPFSMRMASNTAFNFLLCGLSLFCLDIKTRYKGVPAQLIAIIIFFISWLTIVGYLYRVQIFSGVLYYIPMSVHSASCFLLLSLSLFLAKPANGIMGELTKPLTGRFVARLLIPAAIFLPVLLGLLALWSGWSDIVSFELGVTLLVLAIILIFLALTYIIIISLNRRDILKQLSEKSLRENEQQVQTIFNSAPDAVIVMDESGKIVHWNPKAESLLGWSREEVSGKLLSDVIIPERFREAHQKGMAHFFATGEAPLFGKIIETYALTKSGPELEVALNIAASPVHQGRHLFIGFLRDLTARKKAEEKFKSLLDSAPDAMIITNDKAEIVLINRQTELVFGYTRSELIGKPVEVLIPNDFRTRHKGHRDQYFSNPKVRAMGAGLELFAMRRDGTQFPVEISLAPLKTEEGLLVSASVRDITDRKKAEEKFRSLLDSAPDAMIITNDKGDIVLINQQTELVFGYNRSELIGKPVEILIPSDFRNRHKGHRDKYFSNPKMRAMGAGLELFAMRRDGTQFPVEISLAPLQTEEGLLVSASVRNITDRKKAEEKFRSLLDSAPDATVIVNEAGLIQLINHQTEKLFGYTRNELIGQPVEILIPAELRGKHVHHREGFMKAAGTRAMGAGIELNAVKKNGNRFPVEISLSPIQTEEGLLVSASVRDITDRKKSAEQIAYMAKLMEDISEAVFSTDINFNIKSWNYAAETLYGYSAVEAIGQPISEIIRAQFAKEERESIRSKLKEKGHWKGEAMHLDKNGTPLYLLISTTSTRNAQGEINGYVSVCRDISERKKLEEQLKKTNQEMEAFTYSVSHDLRAPLRGIVGFTTILEEDYASRLDDEARRITSIIRNNTLKMGHLIDDLLAFSRTGKQELIKTQVDTQSMVREIIRELEEQNQKPNGIFWKIGDLPEVRADRNTLRQVWINLISNAIKYSGSEQEPFIEIGSRQQQKEDVFFVKDNGVGFDDQYKHKLFKVFQRLHSTEEFEGTGVGLALVEKIISRHGGKVWAEGKIDEGACFYFTLPH